MYLTIDINITEFSLNSASIYWNSGVFDRRIVALFLNNTLKVHNEVLIRCPETIQYICMGILVLNKTITFIWLMKIMQILGIRLKLFGFDNHAKPKSLGFGNHFRPKRFLSSNHARLKCSCQTQALWVWQSSQTQAKMVLPVFSPSPSSQPNRQKKWKRRGHQIDREEDRVAKERRR